MKLLSLAIGVFMLALPGHAGVTKWVDAQGRVHYSERPPTGIKSDHAALRGTVSVGDGISAVPEGTASPVGEPVITIVAPRKGEVWIYTTPSCGYCRLAEEHMRRKGISFTAKDITRNSAYKAEFRALGSRGVPVTLAGKQRINGYRTEAFEAFLKSAGF
jgi:glutaredoxin